MRTYNYSDDLRNIEAKNDIIIQQMKEGFQAIHSHAESSARAFYSELATKIPIWINEYKCYHHVNNIFKLRSQVNAYTEELVDALQRNVTNETKEWVEHKFVPLVQREITTLSQAVNSQTQAYCHQLNQLNIPMEINKNSIVKSTTPSTSNRIISTGASILIGDLGGAIMGGAGGSNAMLKTMGCEFGAGIILGVASLFTPVGLAALVVSAILSAFVGGAWALSSIEKNVRKTLVKKTKENICSTGKADQLLRAIHTKIDSYLNIIQEDVNRSLQLAPLSA